MRPLLTLFVLITTIVFSSCRKEKTSWDSNWSAPLIHGKLSIDDIVPPENSKTNSDGYLSVIFHDTLFSFNVDTLFRFPDTTGTEYLNIATSGDVTINPTYFSFNPSAAEYDFNGAELKRMVIRSGTGTVELEYPWTGKTEFLTGFPLFLEPGNIEFERAYEMEAASPSSPFVLTDQADFTDYDMDLRGVTGDGVNTVASYITISSLEPTESFTVTNSDSVRFSIKFENLKAKYAKGYFGQHTLSDTVGVAFNPLKNITAGTIDIDSVKLNVSINNGFAVSSNASISKLTGVNTRTSNQVDLSFPQLGNSININPGTGSMSSVTPSEYPMNINTANSNIDVFLENLSDSLVFGFEVAINPDGNVSGGNDELFPESSFDLILDADIPMNFSANDLTLVDTFDINYTPREEVAPDNGSLTLQFDNGFPLGAEARFYLLDENNVVMDSLVSSSLIASGIYNTSTFETTTTQGSVNYSFSDSAMDLLETADKMMLKIIFNSDGGNKVRVPADAYFDFNVRTDLKVEVEL